jgi:hypothetical protein
MAEQQSAEREKQQDPENGDEQKTATGNGSNGKQDEVATYEQELAGYLQERIKPGLNSGAIPLLARSIAKEIARRERPQGESEGAKSKADDEGSEAGDNGQAAAEAEAPDFEADMRELQAELGEDWVLSFSVHGDEGWLTAAKDDGSQHVEAQTADVLSKAVELLNESGGRSG